MIFSSFCRKMTEPTDACILLRKRYYVMLCMMLGYMVMVMLRTNLSICLVHMTSKRTVIVGNTTDVQEPEFRWTSLEKGMILSSFSTGFLFGPFGGVLATKIGGVKSYGIGICVTGLVTILSPALLKINIFIYVIARWLEGISESISTASQGIVMIHWVPENERTFLSNSAYFGFSLGIIVSYPVCGYLVEKFDWEYTFCITGGMAVVWSLLWFLTVREFPADDKFMLKSEKNHFQCADAYDVNIEEIGWLSSIPFYFELFARIPGAALADYLRKKKILSKTTVHRTFILGAQIGGVIFLILTATANTFSMSFIAVSISRSFFSFASISYAVLPLDIGAHYSGFIYGTCSTAMSIGYILNPLIIGLMVTNHSTAEWSRYFFALCALNVWASLIFAIFGSGELQTWAKTDDHQEDEKENSSNGDGAEKRPGMQKCL